MKKLFTTLSILSAVGLTANAQKNIDLEVSLSSPEANQSFPNLAVGDTFKFVLDITNNGPEAITATDTLGLYAVGYAVNTRTSNLIFDGPNTITGQNVAVGETLTVTLPIIKGDGYLLTSGDTIVYHFPNDATASFTFTGDPTQYSYYFGIAGWDATGLFNDPGLVFNADGLLAGFEATNEAAVSGVSFGSTSIFDINGLDKKMITVYPNPTSSDINFEYTFNNSTEAVANVYDVSGRIVLTKDFGTQHAGSNKFVLNTNNLPAGNYTLEFITNENRGVSKFTVAK